MSAPMLPARFVPQLLRELGIRFGGSAIGGVEIDGVECVTLAQALREMAGEVDALLVHAREVTADRDDLAALAGDHDPLGDEAAQADELRRIEELYRRTAEAADLYAHAASGGPVRARAAAAMPIPETNVVLFPVAPRATCFNRPDPTDGDAA